MAYTRQQAKQVFAARMRSLLLKDAKIKQEQDIKDKEAWDKKQAKNAKLSLLLQSLNIGQAQGEKVQAKLLQDIYYEGGYAKPKYGFKPPTKPLDIPGKIKRFVDPKSALEYRPEYKEFKIGEGVDPTMDYSSLFPGEIRPGDEEDVLTASEYDKLVKQREEQYGRQMMEEELAEYELETARTTVPIAEELAVDEPIAYERLEALDPTVPAPLDMAALNESAKRDLYERWYQSQAEGIHPEMREKLPDYESWKEGVEAGTISATSTEKVLVPPGIGTESVPLTEEDEFYTPTEEVIETDDLPTPTTKPSELDPLVTGQALEEKTGAQFIEGLKESEVGFGERESLLKTKRIRDMVDPMGDVDLGVSPELEGAPDIVTTSPQLRGAEGAQDVEIPDAKSGIGKTFLDAKTGLDMLNIGRILTDKKATSEEKGVAAVQGTKMLSEIALKKAKTEGTKAFAKGVSTTTGGLLGGYTAVTEAGEAKEAWEEKDYDEAILHGIGSVSGGMQTAGAGMMLSGIGAPLGAVLYGVGTAASVISSIGLMFEGLFGGGGAPAVAQKPKFDHGRFFESIRRR